MSPRDTNRLSDATTFAHLVGDAIHRPGGGDDTLAVVDAARDTATTTDARPPRPVSPARVGPSRNAHSRVFNDPCNYLG